MNNVHNLFRDVIVKACLIFLFSFYTSNFSIVVLSFPSSPQTNGIHIHLLCIYSGTVHYFHMVFHIYQANRKFFVILLFSNRCINVRHHNPSNYYRYCLFIIKIILSVGIWISSLRGILIPLINSLQCNIYSYLLKSV